MGARSIAALSLLLAVCCSDSPLAAQPLPWRYRDGFVPVSDDVAWQLAQRQPPSTFPDVGGDAWWGFGSTPDAAADVADDPFDKTCPGCRRRPMECVLGFGCIDIDFVPPRLWEFRKLTQRDPIERVVEYDQFLLDDNFYRPIWRLTGDICQDARNLYSHQGLAWLGLGVGIHALLANTTLDQQFRESFQANAVGDPDAFRFGWYLGEVWVVVPAVLALWGAEEIMERCWGGSLRLGSVCRWVGSTDDAHTTGRRARCGNAASSDRRVRRANRVPARNGSRSTITTVSAVTPSWGPFRFWWPPSEPTICSSSRPSSSGPASRGIHGFTTTNTISHRSYWAGGLPTPQRTRHNGRRNPRYSTESSR